MIGGREHLQCKIVEGKIALVTGASSGLGRHLALTFAGNGARVAVAARRLEVLRELVAEIQSTGREAFAQPMDVTDATSVRTAVQAIDRDFGPVEILVNNSGVTSSRPVLEHTEEVWDRIQDTNAKGTFLVSIEVARRMRERGMPGAILNIASILGIRQAGQVAAYAASKAAVIQLTKVMALELAQYGIRVNAIAPGYFATELNHDFFASPAGEALIKRIPVRRLGEPSELDGVVLLLCSEAASYITGAVIPVDGGHLVSTL